MRELKIGRSPENDIIMDDNSVSRQHASILIDGANYSVRDNGSSNGTYINGIRINGIATLNRSDILKVGNSLVPWMNYIGMTSDSDKTRVNIPSQPFTTTNTNAAIKGVPNASGALTCGIIGLVFSFLSWIGIIGLILCIIAIALGGSGVAKYKTNPNSYSLSSYKNARAGMVLGIIGASLFFLALIIVLAVFNF